MEAILSKMVDGTLPLIRALAYAPCILDGRYLGHIVFGIIARLSMLKNMSEWGKLHAGGHEPQKFVALLKEIGTDLPTGETMDWIGFTEVPEQVVEAIQLGLLLLDPAWLLYPEKEIM